MDLNELDRLLAAATPGPWAQCSDPGDSEIVEGPEGLEFATREEWRHPRCIPDAALAVWLRNNAEAMRDRIRQLERDREAWMETAHAMTADRCAAEKRAERSGAELERLRAASAGLACPCPHCFRCVHSERVDCVNRD